MHAFLVQEFKERNACDLVDLSECSCHGKGAADGISNVPVSHLRTAARNNEPVGVGIRTRGLVLFEADKMRSPSKKRRKWLDYDGYLIAYYPDDAFDEKQFKAVKGYVGSTLDHFYVNDGLHRLATRLERCPCRKCIVHANLWSPKCELKAWCGAVKHVNMEYANSSAVVAERCGRVETLAEFAKTLTAVGPVLARVHAVRVNEEDSNDAGEDYYLCRVVKQAWALSEDCFVAGNEFPAGELVVMIKWFEFVRELPNGDREYKLQSLPPKGEVHSVVSFVRKVVWCVCETYIYCVC